MIEKEIIFEKSWWNWSKKSLGILCIPNQSTNSFLPQSCSSYEHLVNSFLVEDHDPIPIQPETWIQSYTTWIDLIVITATARIMSCFKSGGFGVGVFELWTVWKVAMEHAVAHRHRHFLWSTSHNLVESYAWLTVPLGLWLWLWSGISLNNEGRSTRVQIVCTCSWSSFIV